LFRTEAFHQGRFEIQDICSQAVGLVCQPKPGETWWDACAGEGGKTLHLSDLMLNKGLIWATDPATWRLQSLQRRAARAGIFNYRAVHWRITDTSPTKNRYDGVLVDAPCSGIGTWQRNPHARWTTTANDVRELARIQIRLLTMGAKSLKPGGKLVYSVCTLTNEETDMVADSLSEQIDGLEILRVSNPFEPDQAPVSKLRLWPQQTGGNGMFIAAWRRSV
jgi:16S rRNA (cytosine967-C5)-methyltransferase